MSLITFLSMIHLCDVCASLWDRTINRPAILFGRFDSVLAVLPPAFSSSFWWSLCFVVACSSYSSASSFPSFNSYHNGSTTSSWYSTTLASRAKGTRHHRQGQERYASRDEGYKSSCFIQKRQLC